MKKIGAITFHASYNFGSNLQAYALQEYVKKIGKNSVNYQIINLRTNKQKYMYNFKENTKGIKLLAKKILYGKKLNKREEKFEKFINTNLNLTKEYNDVEMLKNEMFDYNYYISGSDQLWNLAAGDFEWTYYLDFVKEGKRISYAASAGPILREKSKNDIEKIKELVNKYDCISVREQGTYDLIKNITGRESKINVDPTLLLNKEEWNEIIPDEKLYKKPYILYYTLQPTKIRSKFIKKIGKVFNKKIVVANPSFKFDLLGGFVKKYESGPLEFLNLLKNADLVISSSFHGTVFSILFNKPFFALNGKNDFRISTLLKKCNLEDRTISETDDLSKLNNKAYNIDFKNANENIERERAESKKYLLNALEIN